jgi:hypothetical protein
MCPGWTGDKSKSGNPGRIPIFDCFATDGAFEAADLTALHDMLAAVIDRAAFTRSMHTDHYRNMRSNRADFEAVILPHSEGGYHFAGSVN